MPHRTLDEYLKQTTPTTTKQYATEPKYRITGFYKETHFQETPIGKIPKEWKIMKLKQLSSAIYYGVTAKAVDYNTGLRMLRTTDIKDYKTDWDSLPYCEITSKVNDIKKYLLREGDLIVARAGTVGVSVLVERDFNDAVFGSYLIKVKPIRKLVYPKFLHYYFQSKSYWSHISKAQGSTLKNINLGILRSLSVPLPPLEEQWGVAEVLSSVDEAIEATERLIGRLERLKRGLMQELLTKGIGHREYKQTSIGKIPKQWKIVRLGEVADLFQYGLSVKMYDTGKYPIVKMDSIINGEVKPINIKYVNINEKTFRKYKLEKGDILINRTNSYELVGRTGIFLLNGDYVFASYLIRIRPKKHLVNPRFLTYYLIFSNDRLRQIAARAVSQANINATNLKKFKMALPPLKEQEIITNVLLSYDEWIKLEEKRKEKLERLKRGLMDLLLTGRVRVRIEKLGESEDGSNPGRGG